MKTTTIPYRLKDKIKSGECVLFLGAGATRDAGGPTGEELAVILANHFGKTDIPTQDFMQFASMLASLPDIDREDIDEKLVEILKRLEPSPGHFVIPILPWRAIFTTNYDRLVEIAYDNVHSFTGIRAEQALQVAIMANEQASVSDRSKLCLFKMHGCISAINRGNPLVITQKDLRATQKKRNKMLRFLKSLAQEHALLFIGYSFTDGVVLSLLEDLEDVSPYHSHRLMYMVTPSSNSTEHDFLESKNFTIIHQSFSDFMSELSKFFDDEARKIIHGKRLEPIRSSLTDTMSLPPRLRLSLDNQLEFMNPDYAHPQADARPFLKGLPPTIGDLKNRNDIERDQENELIRVLSVQLESEAYLRPLIVVLGTAGSGKATLCLRCAYELAERGEVAVIKLRSHDQWKKDDLIDLAKRFAKTTLFVCDDLEVYSRFKAFRDLRLGLSAARCRSVLMSSCQKAVWNDLDRQFPQQYATKFYMSENLTEEEAKNLIQRLLGHGMIEAEGRRGFKSKLNKIMGEYEGSLIVSMLELVGNGKFRDILLMEYDNLSERARKAYQYVALLHQHRLSMPDYLLNNLVAKDWNIFTKEIIQLESELIIVQDLDAGSGRICFRTRHSAIARIITEAVLVQHEDKVRMYRQIITGLGASEEDRKFLLNLLTSRSVRQEIGSNRQIEDFFEEALRLFPDDSDFILHLGKFEGQIGNIDRAFDLLKWGNSIDPRDSYIIHQLGVCEERRAEASGVNTVREAHYQEAQRFYREKQALDPRSHYGFSGEARMQIRRAKTESDNDKKIDLLSSAMDAVRRGRGAVREDDRGILRECEVEAWAILGSRSDLVSQLERIEEEGEIRYASTYHLLACCRGEEGPIERALEALERGLARFPGNPRLISLVLEIAESDFHDSNVRLKVKEYLDGDGAFADIRGMFLKAVSLFYENHYLQSRRCFERIRSIMNRQASGRVRLYLCDCAGEPEERKGVVKQNSRGRKTVVDQESGEQMLLDNESEWISLGEPESIVFRLGFSLAGARAEILSSSVNNIAAIGFEEQRR